MDFYAFLPSNASPEVYCDNTTSHFKTELANRMELHGQWQAALIELHYPNTIAQVLEGENVITLKAKKFYDSVRVKPGRYNYVSDFLKELRHALTDLLGGGRDLVSETEDHRIFFEPFVTNHPNGKVNFSPRLALQLGLEHHGPHPADAPIQGVKPIDLRLGIPQQMFVYMDILSDQMIGHTRAPLLRSIPVDVSATYGTMTIFHCDHPLYFDLNTKSFDTVEIDIRDHAGRYLPFDFGTSTLLVHFRQRS